MNAPLLHRAYVGPRDEFDVGAAHQFNLMTSCLGLREYHHLLEIGCGALRAARLFIPYLLPDRYCGLEPNRWLVEAGLEHELGPSLERLRRPLFRHEADFSLTLFERQFDFILAQSIFSHTSQAQMRRCLEQVKQVLHPDGLFAASFHTAEEDYEGDSWVYPESVAYRPQTLERLAQEAGLRVHSLPWGNQNQQSWLLFYHPGRSLALPEISELEAMRLETTVLRRRLETFQRGGISPADHARLIEQYHAVLNHPAVQRAVADDTSLRLLIGASPADPE